MGIPSFPATDDTAKVLQYPGRISLRLPLPAVGLYRVVGFQSLGWFSLTLLSQLLGFTQSGIFSLTLLSQLSGFNNGVGFLSPFHPSYWLSIFGMLFLSPFFSGFQP